MSTPLTARQLHDLVTKNQIPAVWYDGWATRNRGNRGTGWGPVHGVMLHHTVTRTVAGTIGLVRDTGTPGVPAPLYAGVVDDCGILHMVGWGRCNHAGHGDDDVLRAVIEERTPLPSPNEANTDGNSRFYGFAGINMGDGQDSWPAAQLHTLAKVSGLVCRAHGWTERSIIGHREWQPGKVDPRDSSGSLMPRLRQMARGVIR